MNDYWFPKTDNIWGFCVHHIKSDQFIENQRAIFEVVKADERLTKIIFTKTNHTQFYIEGEKNTIIVKLHSLKGLYYLLKCKVLFLTHSISMDFSIRYGNGLFSIVKLRMSNRIIINLWHGIALKKLLALTNDDVKKQTNRVAYNRWERSRYNGLVCSSEIDSYAMATMFYPISYDRMWITGYPKNDFLLKDLQNLPKYFRDAILAIEKLVNGKRLIVYAPTYRQTSAVQDAFYYQFSVDEIDELKKLLKAHNAVLGVRLHYFRNSQELFNIESYIDNDTIIDLGHYVISEISAVIRMADVVVTDYSSLYIDALYLNKPVVSFAYDFEDYKSKQDGILYDMSIVFPGPVIQKFSELVTTLDGILSGTDQMDKSHYKISQNFYYKYIDTNNSRRIVDNIMNKLSMN